MDSNRKLMGEIGGYGDRMPERGERDWEVKGKERRGEGHLAWWGSNARVLEYEGEEVREIWGA